MPGPKTSRQCKGLIEFKGVTFVYHAAPVMESLNLAILPGQKVGLVGALAHEPALVVLDEPTNGLDPLAVVALRGLLAEATARGGAVLVTSHHFDELARVADRVEVLHRGRVVDSLTPDGPDLERTFLDTILAADRALSEQR